MADDTVDRERIVQGIHASAATISGLSENATVIGQIARILIESLQSGGKVLTAGNGGSAAEALHMSEELVGRFRTNRPSLPAVSLVADSTALTCIGNDFGFDAIFSRQVEGLGAPGDVLVVFSTSGQALNLRRAVQTAADRGLRTVAMLGRDGGELAGMADVELIVSGAETERIQEAHQVVLHLVLDEIEHVFTEAS